MCNRYLLHSCQWTIQQVQTLFEFNFMCGPLDLDLFECTVLRFKVVQSEIKRFLSLLHCWRYLFKILIRRQQGRRHQTIAGVFFPESYQVVFIYICIFIVGINIIVASLLKKSCASSIVNQSFRIPFSRSERRFAWVVQNVDKDKRNWSFHFGLL